MKRNNAGPSKFALARPLSGLKSIDGPDASSTLSENWIEKLARAEELVSEGDDATQVGIVEGLNDQKGFALIQPENSGAGASDDRLGRARCACRLFQG